MKIRYGLYELVTAPEEESRQSSVVTLRKTEHHFHLDHPMQFTPRYATAFSPVNIALIKYWGKVDEEAILPLNDSISFTLDSPVLKSVATACVYAASDPLAPSSIHSLSLNGAPPVPLSKRLTRVVSSLIAIASASSTLPPLVVHFVSFNTFPTAAGLASSAAGLAACTVALAEALRIGVLENGDAIVSAAARMGSGSACRSTVPGVVTWRASSSDPSDADAAVAAALPTTLPLPSPTATTVRPLPPAVASKALPFITSNGSVIPSALSVTASPLRVAVVVLRSGVGPKDEGSTGGMAAVGTSPLLPARLRGLKVRARAIRWVLGGGAITTPQGSTYPAAATGGAAADALWTPSRLSALSAIITADSESFHAVACTQASPLRYRSAAALRIRDAILTAGAPPRSGASVEDAAAALWASWGDEVVGAEGAPADADACVARGPIVAPPAPMLAGVTFDAGSNPFVVTTPSNLGAVVAAAAAAVGQSAARKPLLVSADSAEAAALEAGWASYAATAAGGDGGAAATDAAATTDVVAIIVARVGPGADAVAPFRSGLPARLTPSDAFELLSSDDETAATAAGATGAAPRGTSRRGFHDQTGLMKWGGADALRDVLLAWPSLTANRTVVELGCGAVASGTVAAALCGATAAVAVDGSADTVAAAGVSLRALRARGLPVAVTRTVWGGGADADAALVSTVGAALRAAEAECPRMTTQSLERAESAAAAAARGACDVVVASEVLYSVKQSRLFCDAVAALRPSTVVLSHVTRSFSTVDEVEVRRTFEAGMAAVGLRELVGEEAATGRCGGYELSSALSPAFVETYMTMTKIECDVDRKKPWVRVFVRD